MSSLRVPTPSGALVPLSALGDISVDYGRASINRENGQRYIGVRMNVDDLDASHPPATIDADVLLGQRRVRR